MSVEKDTVKLRLQFNNPDGDTFIADRTYEDYATWARLLDDFVTFLESTGYVGVREKISVQYSPFMEDWTGPIHDFPEDIPGAGQ